MDQKTSQALVKLREEAIEAHGIDEWGIIFVDGRWTAGFRIGHKSYPGSGKTPQEAYENALHAIAGTTRPPF